jgi:hypothetical protein
MRILAPSIVDPARHRGGAGAVTRAILALLARPPLGASIETIVPHSTRDWHCARQGASLIWSLASALPAKAHFTRSRAFRRAVSARLAGTPFDLLLLNGTDLVWLLDDLPQRPPTLLLAHNNEHALYRSQIDRLRLPAPLRTLLRHDCEKLRRYEQRGQVAAGHVLFVSQDEVQQFRHDHPDTATLHVPPLFDYPPFEREPHDPARPGLDIGFLGNFEWWPNRAGLGWFLREVWPHVGPEVTLHVFGQASERAVRPRPRLQVHGFAPHLEDVWRRCDIMICPIGHGAGVNVKLAEAVYNRMPVLARRFAIRGLDLPRSDSLVTLESAAEWIDLLRSPAARALAARRVPAAIADRFRTDAHAAAVQAFAASAAGLAPVEPPLAAES